MRRIPGNEYFKARIEYTSIVEYYFGRSWYIASQIGLNGALQSLNIISVIQSAQVFFKKKPCRTTSVHQWVDIVRCAH